MAEKNGKKISKEIEGTRVEFVPAEDWTTSSPAGAAVPFMPDQLPAEDEAAETVEHTPEFLELAVPKLPALSQGNRARLLMQSPNRLYFYWSIGRNPFHTLSRALGQPGGYMLVLRLIDLSTGEERLHPVEERGNWWFDVDADRTYRAEIGFYAVNRPYIRVIFSNTVTTPRKSPSPRTAETAQWRVPAQTFARVLDAAGFQRDAFDVALAGEDVTSADRATHSAFAELTGRSDDELAAFAHDEMRYAMFALASGVGLAELRGLISERLFAFLSSIAELSGERALAVLKERFEFDAEDFELDEDEPESAVFGASLVGFPRRRRRRGWNNPNPLLTSSRSGGRA